VAKGILLAFQSNATRAFNLSDHLGTSAVPESNTVVDPTIIQPRSSTQDPSERLQESKYPLLCSPFYFFLTSTKLFTGGSGHKSVRHDVCHLRSIGAFIVCNPIIIIGSCRQLASILEVLFERFGFEPSGLCRTSIWWRILGILHVTLRKAFPRPLSVSYSIRR
jgi:hypothetical protein